MRQASSEFNVWKEFHWQICLLASTIALNSFPEGFDELLQLPADVLQPRRSRGDGENTLRVGSV